MFGKREYYVLFNGPPGNKDAKPPHGRRMPSFLQLWQWGLIRINQTLDFQRYVKYVKSTAFTL